MPGAGPRIGRRLGAVARPTVTLIALLVGLELLKRWRAAAGFRAGALASVQRDRQFAAARHGQSRTHRLQGDRRLFYRDGHCR